MSENVQVLALLPSLGLGGGIEAYANLALDAYKGNGANVIHVNLLSPGKGPNLTRKIGFALEALIAAWRLRGVSRSIVVCFLPGMFLLAGICSKIARVQRRRFFVVFYGRDAWSLGYLSRAFLRWLGPELIAISHFTAGAVASIGRARIVPPAVPSARSDSLVSISRSPESSKVQRILSVFRLEAYAQKGAVEVIAACEALRAKGFEIQLTLAGMGPTPKPLLELKKPWIEIIPTPSDVELINLYRAHNVFVLATKFSSTRKEASGEGFGIVLVEAALAGLPVVAPAYGGSWDAFIDEQTGIGLSDERLETLTAALERMFTDPKRALAMGTAGRLWATRKFSASEFDRRWLNATVRFVDHRSH